MSMNREKYVTGYQEAAEVAGIDPEILRELVARRKIRAIKPYKGKVIFIRGHLSEDIDDLEEAKF